MAMPSSFFEIGSTGLRQTSGFIREEFLRELRGQKGAAKYREMEADDIVGACLFAIEQLAGQVDWSVEPPEVSTEGPSKTTAPNKPQPTKKALPPGRQPPKVTD